MKSAEHKKINSKHLLFVGGDDTKMCGLVFVVYWYFYSCLFVMFLPYFILSSLQSLALQYDMTKLMFSIIFIIITYYYIICL